MKELQGRVAVITGAGSGIGAALAHAGSEAGMSVVLADVEPAAPDGVADEVGGRAGHVGQRVGRERRAAPGYYRDAGVRVCEQVTGRQAVALVLCHCATVG